MEGYPFVRETTRKTTVLERGSVDFSGAIFGKAFRLDGFDGIHAELRQPPVER